MARLRPSVRRNVTDDQSVPSEAATGTPGAFSGTFTVEGDPVPQPRPRVYRNGGVSEDPRATRHKQATIMAAKRARCPRLTGEVELSVVYYRANHRRCDLDNLAKLTQDALTGIAYLDDSQIVALHARKAIDSTRPRTEVSVRAWPPVVVGPTPEFINAWDQERYPGAYLRQGLDEAAVQRMVQAKLRALGAFVLAVDAGARLMRGRVMGAARRAGLAPDAVLFTPGRTGVGVAGLADLVGCDAHGRMVAIEVKRPAHLVVSPKTGKLIQSRPAGQPTEAQLAFLLEVHRRGGIAGVVWSPADVDQVWWTGRGELHQDVPTG